jgi:hypothetical protein
MGAGVHAVNFCYGARRMWPGKADAFSAVIAGLDPAIHLLAKKMDHQNSGVPEFWHSRWTQIGNIRFAVVKPAGDSRALTQTYDTGLESSRRRTH